MKRIALVATASALVLAGGTTGAGASLTRSGGTSARPTLRIVDTDPLTVRGANFKAGEAVTVAAVVRHAEAPRALRQLRVTRTGTAGGFTVALRSLQIEGCAAIVVTATGASGDTAAAKIIPECPAP